MGSGGDGWIAGLTLVAAGAVLVAPVLGRAGAPLWADAAMVMAATSGVAAFGLAGWATIRAARRNGAEERRRDGVRDGEDA